MKKLTALILAAVLCLSLTACAGSDETGFGAGGSLSYDEQLEQLIDGIDGYSEAARYLVVQSIILWDRVGADSFSDFRRQLISAQTVSDIDGEYYAALSNGGGDERAWDDWRTFRAMNALLTGADFFPSLKSELELFEQACGGRHDAVVAALWDCYGKLEECVDLALYPGRCATSLEYQLDYTRCWIELTELTAAVQSIK